LGASRYQGKWTKNASGPLSLEEALAFVRSLGVEILDEIHWFVAEHEGLTLRAAGLEGEDENGPTHADARYFRISIDSTNVDASTSWERLRTGLGKISVCLRAEVLESDEHCLYVFSHESHELTKLKEQFDQRNGWMTYREMALLIEPRLGGAIHEEAVRFGDELVRQLRTERGIES
jgi:hypothetical protein